LGGASIYILLCSDGSYYAGVTRRSVEERVSEHAQGLMPGYTFTRRPVKLIFSEQYERVTDAIAAERRIKGEEGGLHARGFLGACGSSEEEFEEGRVSRDPNRRCAMDRPSRLLLRKSASGRRQWGARPKSAPVAPPEVLVDGVAGAAHGADRIALSPFRQFPAQAPNVDIHRAFVDL